MARAQFDGLTTISREYEDRSGVVETCQGQYGTNLIRLRIISEERKQRLLAVLPESVAVRLEAGSLEVLLPWHEGISLREWLAESEPTLRMRKEACQTLLEQQLTDRLPPMLTELSAVVENLRFDGQRAYLQYIPLLRRWPEEQSEKRAVNALALVLYEVMTCGLDRWAAHRLPPELIWLGEQAERGAYRDLGQLQQDLARLPDEVPSAGAMGRTVSRRIGSWLQRYGKYVATILVALLMIAAMLSLVQTIRELRSEKDNIWSGMPVVGDQDLRGGGG